jgi:pimeloyl-ACP methyl ester carboxylesterase
VQREVEYDFLARRTHERRFVADELARGGTRDRLAHARKNFPVYVVDHVGRGRSGFDPTLINRARRESNPSLLPSVPLFTRERAFEDFRFGPTRYQGGQFPVEAQDQYYAQLVPDSENMLAGGGANTVKALGALLDKTGPAIVLVDSQSGRYGLDLIRQHADKVRAFVDVEGSCGPLSADDGSKSFRKVPTLIVFGDYTEGSTGPYNDERGNGHMTVMDKNNLQIADFIIDWLSQSAAFAK